MNVTIPAEAHRSGMATFRKGPETIRVQHWCTRDSDWIVRDGQPVEALTGMSTLTRLWAIGDELIENGWRCSSTSITGMGASASVTGMGVEVNRNYFRDGVSV